MTASGFQSALARMMVDPFFRDALRHGADADLADVTDLERGRLTSVANDPGLDITITLYQAWRLTKVLSLMPLTCRALGDGRVAEQLHAFWSANPARSLYFVGECIAFCDQLQTAVDTRAEPLLHDALTYERGRLELRQEIARGVPEARRTVRLSHEPDALVIRLSGRAPGGPVPQGRYELTGTLTPANDERWEVVALDETASHEDPGGVQWQTIGSPQTTSASSSKSGTRSRRSRAARSIGTASSSTFARPGFANGDAASGTRRSSRARSPSSGARRSERDSATG